MCFICKKSGAGCVRSLLCILFIPFEKAGVWLTAYSFMSQQNCARVIFTWERLISYNRITSVWSEWAVCTVCPYKDPWLTVFCFFCLFVFSEDFCMPLHDNYTFPPPPIHSLRSFSRKRQSALSSSQPTLLLSVGSISQTSPFRWLYSQCIWKCTSFFFLFLPRWHTSDVAWLWGYRMWSITKRKKKKEKKRSSDSMLDEPAFVWRTNFDDDFTQESTAEQQENNQPLKLLKESFYPSQFWNDFSFTSQEHLWV